MPRDRPRKQTRSNAFGGRLPPDPRLRAIAAAAAAGAATTIGLLVTAAPPRSIQEALQHLTQLAVRKLDTSKPLIRKKDFGGWRITAGCNTRQRILLRDLRDVKTPLDKRCPVLSGILHDPYTGKTIHFNSTDPTEVPIDHVVALADAWRTGAADWDRPERVALANDDDELLAVSRDANSDKSDSDANEWLPKNKAYDCTYVAKQVEIKTKWHLWTTRDEHATMESVLSRC